MTNKGTNGLTGIIFDIKKYAIHDGPGIRSTIFLKGCPLRCRWCHNPESWESLPEIMVRPAGCIRCGRCADLCPQKAVSIEQDLPVTYPEKCLQCGTCLTACPQKARQLAGRFVTVEEVISEICKDIIFYDQSHGGVTVSGGEPLMQADFTYAILKECRKREIHTAVDTCCFGPVESLRRLMEVTDLFLCDIKHMDNDPHERFTQASNLTILENIRFLADAGQALWIRVPVVPGFNDRPEQIESIAKFARGLKTVSRIDLLPYHSGGFSKAKRMDKQDEMIKQARPDDAVLLELKTVVEQYGFNVRIGG